uniref:Exostosin domain-containing protein n=1 Tax=Parastrongyloides trichosuri TaxID=131310 RepID=A0A0N4ZV94_PARTI
MGVSIRGAMFESDRMINFVKDNEVDYLIPCAVEKSYGRWINLLPTAYTTLRLDGEEYLKSKHQGFIESLNKVKKDLLLEEERLPTIVVVDIIQWKGSIIETSPIGRWIFIDVPCGENARLGDEFIKNHSTYTLNCEKKLPILECIMELESNDMTFTWIFNTINTNSSLSNHQNVGSRRSKNKNTELLFTLNELTLINSISSAKSKRSTTEITGVFRKSKKPTMEASEIELNRNKEGKKVQKQRKILSKERTSRKGSRISKANRRRSKSIVPSASPFAVSGDPDRTVINVSELKEKMERYKKDLANIGNKIRRKKDKINKDDANKSLLSNEIADLEKEKKDIKDELEKIRKIIKEII